MASDVNKLGVKTKWQDLTEGMIIVGAGNMGRALANHETFGRRGFRLVGIFDIDEKTGKVNAMERLYFSEKDVI